MYDFYGNKLSKVYAFDGSVIGEDAPEEPFDPDEVEYANENQRVDVAIFINQIGYDSEGTKRATVTNAVRGDSFSLKSASNDSIAYSGTIKNQIADFSSFTGTGEYYLEYIKGTNHIHLKSMKTGSWMC